MAEKGGFDYLDSVSQDAGSKPARNSAGQVRQMGMEPSPAEGGEGYIGGNTNASTLGMQFVTGKKGTSTDRPIWSEQSSGDDQDQAAPEHGNPGSDSADEKAAYKHPQTDEGLPQTYRSSAGAGDAGPMGSDEPDARLGSVAGNTPTKSAGGFGMFKGSGKPTNESQENAQSVPSSDYSGDTEMDMPQTEFTAQHGGGAPLFKHSKG